MTTTTNTYTIDARGRTLGRVAAEAAKILMGKTRVDYVPNKITELKVTVNNADKLDIREAKAKQKLYTSYSGHPGGLKTETLAKLMERKGNAEALSRAIERMMPRNKLRNDRMKNLTINASN
jgi:large subunit ribosomal protein L13